MIKDLGTVKPGTTLYIPFHTFDSNDPSASVTISGLATTDIEIYKNGSTTQRSSDSGFALLDTDGTDFDTITGVHGISIDLSDNTDAGFYVAGAQYWVVISSITVDAATINFVLATFTIGYPDAVINTTIATLSTQTSFTLTAGPADNDALNNCVVCIHDIASAVQLGFGVVSDYVGATKTITLTAGVSFTAAAGDNISIYPPSNAQWVAATAQTANDNGADINAILTDTNSLNDTKIPQTLNLTASGNIGIDWANVENPSTAVNLSATTTNLVNTTTTNTDMRGTDSALLAASAPTNFGDLSITATTGRVDVASVGGTAQTANDNGADINAILTDTNELQTDWANGGRLDLLIDSIISLLDDARAEPGQGAPPVNPDLATKIDYLYKSWRNKTEQTATTWSLYDDAGTTVDQKSTVSDNGTTATKGEVASGP